MSDEHAGSGDAQADGLPPIDFGAFRALASVLGQSRMLRMTASFFADAERRVGLLEREDATPRDLQEHAHALVSMAGHLGLRQLSALCMHLQELARNGGGLDGRASLRCAVDRARVLIDGAIANSKALNPDFPHEDGFMIQSLRPPTVEFPGSGGSPTLRGNRGQDSGATIKLSV